MSVPPTVSDPPALSVVTWNVDRARLLRDATADFISRGQSDALVAERYEALARGFLPRIKREAAIDIARLLAGCPHVTQGVRDAFMAIGIGIKLHAAPYAQSDRQNISQIDEPENTAMAENRFFAGPLMDNAASASLPPALGHLDPYGLHVSPLDPVMTQALDRAAERRDIEEFAGLVARILGQQKISASLAALMRMMRDKTGEPAALLLKTIGAEKPLLIKSVQSFARDVVSITATVRHTIQYFDNVQPDRARQIVATFLGNAAQKKGPTPNHVTVQSGQSLNLRATGNAENPVVRPTLSQRLTATLKK